MSMMDPFNPRPGPSDDLYREPRDLEPRGGGKAFVWIPVVIVGGVGALIVLASL